MAEETSALDCGVPRSPICFFIHCNNASQRGGYRAVQRLLWKYLRPGAHPLLLQKTTVHPPRKRHTYSAEETDWVVAQHHTVQYDAHETQRAPKKCFHELLKRVQEASMLCESATASSRGVLKLRLAETENQQFLDDPCARYHRKTAEKKKKKEEKEKE